MKKANTSRKAKRISIRRYLPIGVRVHYDVVRNFAPIKLVGLSVMVMIAVFGILLATQTVSPQSEASSTWEKATVQHREYDWGITKPNWFGAAEEDQHREHLDDDWKLWTKQNTDREIRVNGHQLLVNVDVPSDLAIVRTLKSDLEISYSVEEILYRRVSQPILCDGNSWGGASELSVSSSGLGVSTLDLSTSDNGQHYCFKFKLKGDAQYSSRWFTWVPANDPHPEWVFVAPAISGVTATTTTTTTTTTTIFTPEVSVALSPGSITTRPFYTARDTAGNAASANTSWHYVVVSSSSACRSSSFVISQGGSFSLPSGSSWRPTSQDITNHQGKYICFRARNSAGTDFGHMRINLGGTTTTPTTTTPTTTTPTTTTTTTTTIGHSRSLGSFVAWINYHKTFLHSTGYRWQCRLC